MITKAEFAIFRFCPEGDGEWGRTFNCRIEPTLRSELWKLMRIARFAMPCALLDALISPETFGDADRSLGNPIDCEDAAGRNLTKSTGCIKFTHIGGFREFRKKESRDLGNSKLLMEVKRPTLRELISKFRIYYILKMP